MSQKSSMPKPDEIIELSSAENANKDSYGAEHRDGHTLVVTTVRTETITTTEVTEEIKKPEQLIAVPVLKTNKEEHKTSPLFNVYHQEDLPSCSNSPEHTSKAIVPLSSSLPSKLLRLHAKRSAQALREQQMATQCQSLDSQFGSNESITAEQSSGEDFNSDTYDIATCSPPTTSPSPTDDLPNDNSDEKLDVGMGSSIECSDESEEDDELKPLAIDNHVLEVRPSTSQETSSSLPNAELSEENLEKFRKHHHPQMDNIYLHPNFKYEYLGLSKEAAETSPPPAVAPANSPTDQKRVHRSFLNMKKTDTSETIVEQDHSVVSQSTNASDKAAINEVDTLDASLIPNEELAVEIAEAVEFYFSNDSILKDAFLLKHVRRNKEGFVSLKLVSSFKRVRQLTKDWRVVGNAVRRKSRKIELNDLGTKVRRMEPLPNFDETMPSRTIVACDLPLDKLTIEKVSDIFSKCGEIALIRILKPGMAIPVDVRQFMNKYPEMQQKECALVEYLESSSAREAHNMQGPFKVYEMVAPKKKTGKKAVIQMAAPVVRMVENYRHFNEQNYERTRGGSFSGVIPHEVDMRFKLKRNNSDIHHKTYTDMVQGQHGAHHYSYQPNTQSQYTNLQRNSFGSEHHIPHHHQHYQQTRGQEPTPHTPSSPGVNMNYFSYSPRRYSNASTMSTAHNVDSHIVHGNPSAAIGNSNVNTGSNVGSAHTMARRLSNEPQEVGNYGYSELNRRASNCSESVPVPRRDSNCSEGCPYHRRISDLAQQELYRKNSQGSMVGGERRFSNGSFQFERSFSNASDLGSGTGFPRRMSNEFNTERKPSLETHVGTPYEDSNVGGGGGGYNIFPRRYSNNFNNVSSKLAAYDNAQYINGRRISTDSGYDRRYSFGSEYEGSPRSRTGSFLNNYKHGNDYDNQPRSRTNSFLDGSPRSRSGSFAQRTAENLVRTPLGPDGSKGFSSRMRKMTESIATTRCREN
uniref:HTH La-type RNA-binding domain-containing protein n=1 Tax=Glossina brevipalpis TaxID=37001 RepID=A0A1A9WMY3_9MUSC